MKQIARCFFAAWYLLGWMLHVYLAFGAPQIYVGFGKTALPPVRQVWSGWVVRHIRACALVLAGFELLVGLAMIGKGWTVRLAFACSMLFNTFLVLLGLGMPRNDTRQDFLANRLPNLLFVMGQVPLLFCRWDRSLPELVASGRRRAESR